MRVIHVLNNQKLEGEIYDGSFLMTNKNGGFAWVSDKPGSKYQGVFFSCDGKLFRMIESFGGKKIDEIENDFFCIKRYGEKKEKFFMPNFKNSFVYESDEAELFLDFKEVYESDYASYSLEKIENGLVIKMDYRGESYYLAIYFNGDFERNEKRVDRFYDYDKNRNSYPCERNIYSPGKIKAKKIAFSFSGNRENAIRESKDVFENMKKYEKEKEEWVKHFCKDGEGAVNMAYNAAKIMLDGLCDQKGIWAGLPWFFQYWARDELISLKAIYKIDKKISEKIIRKWIDLISDEFYMNSKEKIDESFDGKSVDAVGWLFKRLELFPQIFEEKWDKIKNFFSNLDDNFINTERNSWMDSIERESGIEVQAMKLYILKITGRFGEDFKAKEKLFKKRVKEKYFDGKFLFDTIRGGIRPNIFIAYYFYPQLFTKMEWEKIVDNELSELWCEWGGLASLSKKDLSFRRKYDGEFGESYHNGDSWFWINNLAGLVLISLNRKKYKEKIEKILEASSNEILFSGAIGNHAELSSASSLKSEGAVCQAFSAAMFIEMVDKIV